MKHDPLVENGLKTDKTFDFTKFIVTVEVVPPVGNDAGKLLADLASLKDLPVDGFSVATNPVAKPRMCAMALCALIQQHTGRSAVLHCTTRDHNRISLQALLWGAKAIGYFVRVGCHRRFRGHGRIEKQSLMLKMLMCLIW